MVMHQERSLEGMKFRLLTCFHDRSVPGAGGENSIPVSSAGSVIFMDQLGLLVLGLLYCNGSDHSWRASFRKWLLDDYS